MANNDSQTGSETMTSYVIRGILSAERACECCGNTQLEKNVVLENASGEVLYVGTTCASKLMLGNKKAANVKTISCFAKWVAIANKWLANGHSIETVFKGLCQQSGLAIELRNGQINFYSRSTCEVVAVVA